MTVILNPYLNFKNTAREAIEFYHSVFGGELSVQSFADFGAPVEPDEAQLVMHSQLDTPNGLTLMAADTPSHMEYHPAQGFAVSLSGLGEADAVELRSYWETLAEGATITQPLEKAPWGAEFGMLIDRFGIQWLMNIGVS